MVNIGDEFPSEKPFDDLLLTTANRRHPTLHQTVIFESSRGVYQVEEPDSGRKHISRKALYCTCLAF